MARSSTRRERSSQPQRAVRTSKSIALWTTRTTSSGRFTAAKQSGDVLRGARKDD